jgi:ADP-heptose:LPS heptosyltransferase
LSAIGDVIHTLPTAAVLQAGGWQVAWLVEPAARVLVEGNPAVTQVFAAPPARLTRLGAAGRALRQVRAHAPDIALDMQGLWKSAAWARLSGAARVVGYAGPGRREPASACLLRTRQPYEQPGQHVIDKNLGLLRAVGIDALGTRTFPLPDLSAARARVDAWLAGRQAGPLVVMNPGGGWVSKLWPAAHYGVLARALHADGHDVLVTWGPGEQHLAEAVCAAAQGAAHLALPTTLLELGALAQRARLFVAADTGPLHLACALGVPVVALFGPTDPARNGPFAVQDAVVSRRPACFPCHRRGCAQHANVMATLPVAEVLAAARQRLASAGETKHAV